LGILQIRIGARRQRMPVLLEKPILEENLELEEKAVPAKTCLGATQTATRDAGQSSRLLELPVPVVVLTLWLGGAALMGLCALALYHLLWVLLGA